MLRTEADLTAGTEQNGRRFGHVRHMVPDVSVHRAGLTTESPGTRTVSAPEEQPRGAVRIEKWVLPA